MFLFNDKERSGYDHHKIIKHYLYQLHHTLLIVYLNIRPSSLHKYDHENDMEI